MNKHSFIDFNPSKIKVKKPIPKPDQTKIPTTQFLAQLQSQQRNKNELYSRQIKNPYHIVSLTPRNSKHIIRIQRNSLAIQTILNFLATKTNQNSILELTSEAKKELTAGKRVSSFFLMASDSKH